MVLLVLLALAAGAATYSRHIGEESATSGGTGSCETIQTITLSGKNYTIPGGGNGKLVLEQHLATDAESFNSTSVPLKCQIFPTNSTDQIDRHYQSTGFNTNCSGCPKEGFTPAEGGGCVGQGTGIKPPVGSEPWILNMRATFPRGVKIIITSNKTGKSVVAAGGYEYGPSSSAYIGGAQPEVLNALGILNSDRSVSIGFAQDQTLPYGPITCSTGGLGSGGNCDVPCIPHTQSGYCGSASVAELIKYYTNRNIIPENIYWGRGLLNLLQTYVPSKTWHQGSDYRSAKTLLIQKVTQCKPVIFYNGRSGPNHVASGGLHIMVLVGYDASTDSFLVNNSLPRRCTVQKWTWQQLISTPYDSKSFPFIYSD